MMIEFLPDGSEDCPILRIFEFDHIQAEQLRQQVLVLATGELTIVAIHKLTMVESVNHCQLSFRVGIADKGIIHVGGENSFECTLKRETWHQVADFIAPFCTPGDHGGTFQWLDETSDISLLFTPNGYW